MLQGTEHVSLTAQAGFCVATRCRKQAVIAPTCWEEQFGSNTPAAVQVESSEPQTATAAQLMSHLSTADSGAPPQLSGGGRNRSQSAAAASTVHEKHPPLCV